MKARCLVVLLFIRGVAVADPEELSTVRSQIGWGTSVNPDRVGVATEGGWSGADHQAEVAATAEATVIPRTSVFVTMQYGSAPATTRPAIGAAYQLVDPRHGSNGARITVAYKPEGLTEPEGELEGGLVLSRQLGADSARVRAAYGQDPGGRESDVELGASYIHDLGSGLELGATSRFRHALEVKTALAPRWDAFGGVVGGWVVRRSRVEVLLGVNAVAVTPDPPVTGVLALVSLATEL
jgi:hypothetical protein